MKISSSQIAFHNEHQKTSSHQYSEQRSESQQQVSLAPNELMVGSSTTVDLSYQARIRSEQASSTTSTSTVKQGDQLTTYQQTNNLSSIVSAVLKQEAHIEITQSLPRLTPASLQPVVALQPVVDTEANQLYQQIQQLQAAEITLDVPDLQIEALSVIGEGEVVVLGGGLRVAEEATLDIQKQHLFKEAEQMKMGAEGTITTEDGREISFMLEMEMARNFELEESFEQQQQSRQVIDPLVINLEGGTAGLTSSSFTFDLDADGSTEEISFVTGGSGFLALDINEDGQINDGSELFGTQGTEGFAHLARYDDDGNKWIDESDEIFDQLKVWTRDDEGNDQLQSLKEAGVGAIYLGSTSSTFDLTDSENNLLGQVKRSGMFLMENGQAASIQELDLAVHNSAENSSPTSTLANEYRQQREQTPEPLPTNSPFETSSTLEVQLPPTDAELARVVRYTEEVSEQHEQSESTESSVTTVETESETEEIETNEANPRVIQLDEHRLDILDRLRAKTETRFNEQEDPFAHIRSIIENLNKQREANES